MDNVVQLRKTGAGFTRMDNELYEALIGADLSGRELRVALAIHRLTAGYNVSEARIAASVIADMSGLRREHVSRMISELIRQRVIYRSGGSKGPIGISPANEWKIDPKNEDKKDKRKPAQCAISGTSLVPFPAHNKDSKDNTPSDEGVTARASKRPAQPGNPAREPKAKAQRFTMANLLADNPHAIPEKLISDWVDLRKKKRATITETVWECLNGELTECAAVGIDAETAMKEALMAGWQGFKVDWIVNRLEASGRMSSRKAAGPDFHSGDTSWAHDLGDL